MSQEIRAQSSLIPDPAVRGYLSRLATKLIGSNLLLTLDVLDEDQSLAHEPVWLPGGYMFVSRALIRTARDESEFAGMFAHALAHEISHDSTRMTTVSPGTIPLIVSGGWSAVGPSAARSQQRPLELQADALR